MPLGAFYEFFGAEAHRRYTLEEAHEKLQQPTIGGRGTSTKKVTEMAEADRISLVRPLNAGILTVVSGNADIMLEVD